MTCSIQEDYFRYLYNMVCGDSEVSWVDLFAKLNDTPFQYIIPIDTNRAEDGVALRYRFGRECKYSQNDVAHYLDCRDCSVLEMMIALCIRCEDEIMESPEKGNRIGYWFWNMIVSLGLNQMSDEDYDPDYVDAVLERFLYRRYDRDGKGSLFWVEDTMKDFRNLEIWYQMCEYLNSIIFRGKD